MAAETRKKKPESDVRTTILYHVERLFSASSKRHKRLRQSCKDVAERLKVTTF